MGSSRRFRLVLLALATAALVLMGCPVPFGYYAAGNKLDKVVETSESISASPVATPGFSAVPTSGGTSVLVFGTPTEDHDQKIAIDCATEGALIYYTYTIGVGQADEPPAPDPYMPSTHLYKSSEPLVVSGNNSVIRIKAVAFKALMLPSSIATLSLSVSYTTASSPAFDVQAGSSTEPFDLTITDSTTGATIWYTLDGTPPQEGGGGTTQSGSSPITVAIDGTCTVRAIATEPNHSTSPETVADYVFPVAAPQFTPAGGVFQMTFVASIDAPTDGSEIWYTTNGDIPDPYADMGTQGISPVSVPIGSETTLRAVAYKSGWGVSPVASVTYYFTPGMPSITNAVSAVDSVILTWDPVATATGYSIYYRAGSSVTPQNGTKLSPVASPHTVAGLTGGAQYAFVVTAENTYGESLASPVTVATALVAPPGGLTVVPASTEQVYASWSSVAGASAYEVFTDTSPTGSFTTLAFSGSVTSSNVGTFGPGTINYFKIRSVDASGLPGPLSTAVAGATFIDSDMPVMQSIAKGTYPAPTVFPPGAPDPEYWLTSGTFAFTQGAYTYLVWDPDNQNWGSFAIAAYDANQNMVDQWIVLGNRYLTSVTLDIPSGDIVCVGQTTTSHVPWRTLKQ